MPAWQSKLPDSIDALVQIFTVAEGLNGVTIRDGASVSQARITEVVTVAYTGEDGASDAEALVQREGLGGNPDREQLTIRCVAAVLTGGTNLKAARARAYELFTAAATAIAADRTLGGVVMSAMVSAHQLTQGQIDQGAQAAITFTVTCDAYTGR
ncbi:hypothetical protein ACH41H_36485 [Streptomyces sp. NPDC020800]|uniref:hypothetical protein n=1 Tax=Streptomyces sp. NPDC020800 TaxID=3365092 RepID=UPI0037B209CC